MGSFQSNDDYELNNDEEEDLSGFDFYVYLAPYNRKNEEIGEIQLYKVNSNTKVLNFIKRTFQRHEWKLVHLYNILTNLEVDKYSKFSNILHKHAIIQLIYVVEDDIYYIYKYKKIRAFDDFELRDNYKNESNNDNISSEVKSIKIDNLNDNCEPSFEFYVYIAPYNKKNEEIGKIQLYKVDSNVKVLDFIKKVFKRHEWKIIHLYNTINNFEVDKYFKFSNILHKHAVIQLIYVFEDDIYYNYKYKIIRSFYEYELRDNFNESLLSYRRALEEEKKDNIDNLYNLLLKNANDNKILTKEFSVDKSIKVENFIKSNFNCDIIMFQKGNFLNIEKTFEENNLNISENQYEIYYFEEKEENLSENGYIVRNYAILEKLGEGGLGTVYKAININTLKEYAIKEIKFPSNINKEAYNKVALLSNLNHKYIVKYHESFKEKNYFYIIMELCPKNNLFDFTRKLKNKNQILNENFIWELFIKIIIGVGYLNKEGVIHNNLKTSNIFIFQDGNVKVGDYAIYKILKLPNIKSKNGTLFYIPQEFWNSQENNDKVDSLGLGCILYELCKLDYPYNNDNIFALRENTNRSDYPPIPCNFSKNMNTAINQLLEADQNKRLSLKDFIIQDYIVEISEKVGLLSELHELYPSIIKNESNNTIDIVYKNILRRNDILNESFFDFNFNKESDNWRKTKQKRSLYNLDYYPPTGWIGIGLNINKFNARPYWIDKENGWATAYHGLRLCETKDKNYINFNCNEYYFNKRLELTIKSIFENGLKDGINQPFKYENNSFSLSMNEFKLCGEGVYLSFQIEEAEKYTIPISGYKFVLMCKVCPTKIRESGRFKGEFVADGNYIKPYRILAKINNNNY